MEITTAKPRARELRPLIAPVILLEDLPCTTQAALTVANARHAVRQILLGLDQRLLVVVGPCSIHDPKAALEYARQLKSAADRFRNELVVIMRVYFEKPRTSVGWKGLINDPGLDHSFDINTGLRAARKLLLDINELGLPAGTEFLDPFIPAFLSDLVAWGAIGARTAECQSHRELASGLPMPVGFKNGTSGNVQIALDAVIAARHQHHFLGITRQGMPAIIETQGNDCGHVILRGSQTHSNYEAANVQAVCHALAERGLPPYLMIDCSHGNSQKDHRRQPLAVKSVCEQLTEGPRQIAGVMLESHLVEGKQMLQPGQPLTYGQSITDACLSWEQTLPLLDSLATLTSFSP